MNQFRLLALLFLLIAGLNAFASLGQDGVPRTLFGLSSALMLLASAIFFFKGRKS